MGNKPTKVILLTSVGNSEGKTLTAYNLAIAAARSGKRTLLIEADFRSPSQVESFKLVPDPDSSVEPLQYYGDLYGCIRLVPNISNLSIIPSPERVRQPSTILESSEFRRLLEEVRYRFDFVVVDSPPITGNNDVLTLEPFTDGMVIVTRPIYTASGLLGETADKLTETDEENTGKYRPKLLGAIVNGADIPVDEIRLETVEDQDPISDQPRLQPATKSNQNSIQKRLPSKVQR